MQLVKKFETVILVLKELLRKGTECKIEDGAKNDNGSSLAKGIPIVIASVEKISHNCDNLHFSYKAD